LPIIKPAQKHNPKIQINKIQPNKQFKNNMTGQNNKKEALGQEPQTPKKT
jgi:hypothetical protein